MKSGRRPPRCQMWRIRLVGESLLWACPVVCGQQALTSVLHGVCGTEIPPKFVAAGETWALPDDGSDVEVGRLEVEAGGTVQFSSTQTLFVGGTCSPHGDRAA